MSTQPETAELELTHRFLPSSDSDVTLLLLHGTGGDENDLIPLGKTLLPGAALLSPRGKVLENGMPRFFQRIAEGVFDVKDLIHRTHELADFVGKASTAYSFDARRVVGVGFSNGANIAASLLMLHPEVLAGAVLFRPMVPLTPEKPPQLHGKPVYISSGMADPIVQRNEPEMLAGLLRGCGAKVDLNWVQAGHSLTSAEVQDAREWLSTKSAH